MNIKNFIFNNLSLKIFSLFLAIAVWVLITGKARLNIEKFINIDVEFENVLKNANIYSNPEKVRIKVRGTANKIKLVTEKDFAVKIDLANIRSGVRNYYTRDFLNTEKGHLITSVHPTMIEVNVREIIRKAVPIRLRFVRIRNGKKMYYRPERIGEIGYQYQLNPERVIIEGYRSDLNNVSFVALENEVPLPGKEETLTRKYPLKKSNEILRILDIESVEVFVGLKSISQERTAKEPNDNKSK